MGVEEFRRSFESGEIDAAVETFAPEFAFYHPLDAAPTTDRDRLRVLLGAAREFMGDDFCFIDHLTGTDHQALVWTATIGPHRTDGVDVLKVDENGELTEVRIIMRPDAAVHAWSDAMRERFGGGGPHRAGFGR